MLYTQGNDLTRIQCAFVDTPEVEKIVDFIGGQKAYARHIYFQNLLVKNTTLDIDIQRSRYLI